ncbi:hypothetical protein BKA70DRAFT_1260179 [Coprinopsis sp. MPI-PUGE-AT-0042]|nr:hypothetical protein BKA70DRAFT_1260179 [Coprinopsis sp. MPI-PUGE-AT-0042]
MSVSRALALQSMASIRRFTCRPHAVPSLRSLATLSARSRFVPGRSAQRHNRPFSDAGASRGAAAAAEQQPTPPSGDLVEYSGPLANTWKRLKLFSLASFGLSSTLAPFMFLVESALPYSARFALAGLAVGTSGVSTSLVSWCAKPYVTRMRRYTPQDGSNGGQVVEMTTLTLMLRPRITTVYDPDFLVETRRPMAKWELAKSIMLSPERMSDQGTPAVGSQETVAETVDEKGQVIGRWVVEWAEGGKGTCHEAGSVIRHFNVHEELLT